MSEAEPGYTVRDYRPADLYQAAEVVGRAFIQEPFTLLVLGQTPDRQQRIAELFQIRIADALRRGGVVDVVEKDGQIIGVAIWEPPEGTSSATVGILQDLPHYVRLMWRRIVPAVVAQARVSHATPTTPHWYLSAMATEPALQGHGVGSALLAHGIRRCGSQPAYLEAASPRVTKLYARHGFTITRPVTLWGRYYLTAMWRPGTQPG